MENLGHDKFDSWDVFQIFQKTTQLKKIYNQSLEKTAYYEAKEHLESKLQKRNLKFDQLNLIIEITGSDVRNSEISFAVSVDYFSDTGKKTANYCTMMVTFPRIAGHVGFKKPEIQETVGESGKRSKLSKSQPQWPYPSGTLVMRRDTREIGIVLDAKDGIYPSGGSVRIFTHAHHDARLSKEEVFPLEDQSIEFIPMRLYMPYGKCVYQDGTEVLFNRDYRPLWKKEIDGTVVAMDPTLKLERNNGTIEIFFDTKAGVAWGNPEIIQKVGMPILKAWGVENKRHQILDLLPEVIKARNVDILK